LLAVVRVAGVAGVASCEIRTVAQISGRELRDPHPSLVRKVRNSQLKGMGTHDDPSAGGSDGIAV